MNKSAILIICAIGLSLTAAARSFINSPNIKTLHVVVNDDWLSIPVMQLGGNDVLNVGFDELSHNYHRYVCHVEHCEADWTPSQDIFESDWLEGFNDNPIEDYVNSINTTVLYTHYRMQIPNDRCRLKMSGNYRLRILDEDEDGEEVLTVEFRVVEPLMNVGLGATTNTDVDHNMSHQQVSMTVRYNGLSVTNPDDQIWTVVMQNGREDNWRQNVRPTYVQPGQLRWDHCRELIFDAGNEYHKFEMLDMSHPTMGVGHIHWDGQNYHVFPFYSEPRRNYLYDEDADGAFYIRNSDNIENDYASDYAYVHYKLRNVEQQLEQVYVNGLWTLESDDTYLASYDVSDRSYNAVILQKQGYYSFQYVVKDEEGRGSIVPEEGSFFETENRYQAMVYYKGTGERTWRLVGYQQIVLK